MNKIITYFIYVISGEGMNNLEGKKVSLGTRDCPQNVANSSAFSYECNRGQSQMNAADFRANTVKFEHTSKFVVDICEVVVYSNPSKYFLFFFCHSVHSLKLN